MGLVQKEENVLEHEVFMNQFTEEMEKSFEYLNERTDIVVETTEEMEIDEEGEKPVTEEEVIEKPDAEELKESVLEEKEEETEIPITTEPVEEAMEISDEGEEDEEQGTEMVTEIEQRQSTDHDAIKTPLEPVDMEVEFETPSDQHTGEEYIQRHYN